MGRIEKVVVLSVLFLIAVIVTVSVYPREIAANEAGRELARGELEAGTAEDQASQALARGLRLQPPRIVRDDAPTGESAPDPRIDSQADSELGTGAEPRRLPDPAGASSGRSNPRGDRERPEARGTESGGVLLSSSVAAESTANGTTPRGGAIRGPALRIEADWDLVRVEGLRATWNDDFLVYTCVVGDDFVSIARALYGDAAKADLLQRNNEGVTSLSAGDEVWIPVRDERGFVGTQHVVADGESLWVIAERVYGAGRRWTEIFEANRDVLEQPDAVRSGMTLRIP